MIKPNLHLQALVGIIIASLVVPVGVVFGYSFIDLGLLHGNAEVDSESNMRLEVDTSSDQTELDVDTGLQADLDTQETSTTSGSNILIESGTIISVTRAQVKGSSEEIINITPETVNSRESLQAFATSTVSADENIEALVITDEYVEITYKERGKLFAIMPITFDVTATAYADGRVEVDYPWYAFLMADNGAEVEAGIESAVSAVLNGRATTTDATVGGDANIQSRTGASLTAEEAAVVVARMHSVLRASFEANVAVNGDESLE